MLNTVKFLAVAALSSIFVRCADKPTAKMEEPVRGSYTAAQYDNTKGYWDGGYIITEFDCPDSKWFSPIDIKLWDKVPVVNGRLPTYEETQNGTSIHHYGEKENPTVKPYNMTLPKLAYRRNPLTKLDEIVVVIQIVQTVNDTIVGYRYLTGGCGGSAFHDYRFLTDEEVKKIVEQ